MARYRHALPQLDGSIFLTDGGIETTLIFQDGLALPDFAAFHLLRTAEGTAALHRYFAPYAELARRFGTGLLLESATWRASRDWGERLGYSPAELAEANRNAIRLLEDLRADYQSATRVVLSGCVGPRGDGYVVANAMTAAEAEAYHSEQIGVFGGTEADMVCAITMNYVEEAIGIARAARARELPAAISFTVETDGRLPTGQPLGEAIAQTDRETGGYPTYYMINCAHPDHFRVVVAEGGAWRERIRGIRANASRKSHAELNESTALDSGNPEQLGAQYAELRQWLPRLGVLGGCCGTGPRHVEQMVLACAGSQGGGP